MISELSNNWPICHMSTDPKVSYNVCLCIDLTCLNTYRISFVCMYKHKATRDIDSY